MSSISVDQLSEAITTELENYNKIVTKGTKDEAKKHMDQLVEETKKTAPVGKRKKHYRNSIKSKKTYEDPLSAEYTWYVDGSDYRLSHLLENGHKTRKIRHGKDRTEGTHFIKNASDPIIEDYVKSVEEVCQNG